MYKKVFFTVLIASIIALGTASVADAAQLEARINTNVDSSKFKITYQKTVAIDYKEGGQVADLLRDTDWAVETSAAPDTDDSNVIAAMINNNILSDGSGAHVSNLDITYSSKLNGNAGVALIDYKVQITGDLNNYLIGKGKNPALIDMGWRALSVSGPVMIDGVEINHPFSAIASENPEIASLMEDSEAEALLKKDLINADRIRDLSMNDWHFLFDPTGITSDAGQFGLSDEILGSVVSAFTMGESSFREGRQVALEFEATFTADQTYTVRTIRSADIGNVHVIGFAAVDNIDDLEILGVTPDAPDDYGNTSTGNFPVTIMYGMAAMAVIGGVAFFAYSSRQMKKDQNQGQTGIDPSRLVGYATSESSGGYQTNRGEAQLRDDDSYQQSKNVYEDSSQHSSTAPDEPAALSSQEAACGCASSAEMSIECDCAMQGSCLCDDDCTCSASVCKEHVGSF